MSVATSFTRFFLVGVLFLWGTVDAFTAFVPFTQPTGSVNTPTWKVTRLHDAVAKQRHVIRMVLAAAVTIEKESSTRRVGRGGGAGPAVLDRPEVVERTKERRVADEPVKQRKGQGSEAWEVRIYNDGINTREHVARCLVQVTGLSEITAYQTMMQAHQNGIAVVGRWVYEVAEMYHDALKKKGIVCDIVPVDEE